MKKVFLFSLCLLLHLDFFAQEKISFRDGNFVQIKGEKIASFEELEGGVVRKKTVQYADFKDSSIVISIQVTWASGNLDYLKVYTIKLSQLNEYSLTEVRETEIDENNTQNYFRLPISTDSETPFLYEEYSVYSSVPIKKSFNTFTLFSNQKGDLEIFRAKILKLIAIEGE